MINKINLKKITLIVLMLFTLLSYSQGEQLFADGTASDQDGNTFEWINYGTQDWAIENAEVVTYRDGTAIPQVTSPVEWLNISTGAWCYYDNDPSKRKLYNWYAVAGIHDNDETTPNKEFAPEEWHVPSEAEWATLENYLIANGYNYDGTTEGNKIGKAMASLTEWQNSSEQGAIGNNQSTNNSSGFNAIPGGYRFSSGDFVGDSEIDLFWSSTEIDSEDSRSLFLANTYSNLYSYSIFKTEGISVRFFRDNSTASIENYQSNSITIYPNPTTSIVTIEGSKEYNIKVYDMTGRKIMTHRGTTIDMSNLSPATYIIKAVDRSNNEELIYRVIKK